MSADNDPPRPAPRSPKRSQDEVEEVMEPASKRFQTASPDEGNRPEEEETGATGSRNEKVTAGSAATQAETQGETKPHDPTQRTPDNTTANAPEPAPQTRTAEGKFETQAPPKPKLCGICHEKEGKYKCARCSLPFCTVACNKIHRDNHPPDPEPAPKPPVAAESPEAKANARREPNNPFSVLDDSEQLRWLFKRYPGLQSRLLGILAATEPPPELKGTGNSLNDMMKAKALAASNPKKEQWTHDIGIRNGKEALRKAKNAAGEDGEGVREYVELINHLVSKGEDLAAEEAIRKSAAEKDAELIRQLMAEDR